MIFRQRRIQRHIRTALYIHSNRGDSDRRQDGQNQRKQNAHNKCKIYRHIARRTLLSLAPGLIYTGYSTMHACAPSCLLPHIFPAWDVILPKIFVTSSVILSLKISTSPVATKINNTTSTVPTPSSFLSTSYTLLCSFHTPFTARFSNTSAYLFLLVFLSFIVSYCTFDATFPRHRHSPPKESHAGTRIRIITTLSISSIGNNNLSVLPLLFSARQLSVPRTHSLPLVRVQ